MSCAIVARSVRNASRTGDVEVRRPRSGSLFSFRPWRIQNPRAADGDADKERDTPAPAHHRSMVEEVCHSGADARTQKDPAAGTERHKTPEKPSMPGSRCLDEKNRRRRVLAAHRKSLKEAHQHEQQRSPNANLLVGRENPNQKGRDRHQPNRGGKRELAALFVPNMAKDQASQRTHKKSRGKDAKRREQR